MALTGTLKDFGIAEILQLIGQQSKNGVLHLRRRDEEIRVAMSDGRVVSAEHAGRKQRDRIGAMLVRAGLLSQADLERALEVQRRTLRRLGDLLVELQLVAPADLRQMMVLQTSETLYALFAWKSGTYRFEPGDVEWDPAAVTPVRLEAVLMEGFRQLDEWPMIRRKIASPDMTFVRRADLPRAGAAAAAEDDFGEDERPGASPDERRVYELAEPGRTVAQIVDLSRLGEFTASKALVTLVNLKVLEAVPPSRRRAVAGVGAYARTWRDRAVRGAATAALAALLACVAWLAAERSVADPGAAPALRGSAAERLVTRGKLSLLAGALETWRVENGSYPERLQALVGARLVTRADLRHGSGEEYHYRRTAEGYVLLPPLP